MFGTQMMPPNKESSVARRRHFALMPQIITLLSRSSPCGALGMGARSASMAPSQPQVTPFGIQVKRFITCMSRPIALLPHRPHQHPTRPIRVGCMHIYLDMVAVMFGTQMTPPNKKSIVGRRRHTALMPQTITLLSRSSPCSALGMGARSASMAPSQPQVTPFSIQVKRLITCMSRPIALRRPTPHHSPHHSLHRSPHHRPHQSLCRSPHRTPRHHPRNFCLPRMRQKSRARICRSHCARPTSF